MRCGRRRRAPPHAAARLVAVARVNVGILGAGALGTLVAASLASYATRHDSTSSVRLIVRDRETAEAIQRRGGLAVEEATLTGTARTSDAARATDAAHETEAACVTDDIASALAGIDVLLVAVKTFATRDAVVPLRPHITPHVAVLSLQNGIAAASDLAYALPGHTRIALAPTTEAAMLIEPGLVRRTARGRTHVGWVAGASADDAPLRRYAAFATAAGLATEVASPIEPVVWQKLVANAAINPTTALAGVVNGAILTDAALRAGAAELAREAAAVARACGIPIADDAAVAGAEAVMRATAANRSSMLRDLECGRRTEIDAISGTIVRLAAEHGSIAVPATARVYDEVRARARP